MATNDFKVFAGSGSVENGDVLTPAEYSSDAQRAVGNQAGFARRELVNTALRQTSTITTAVADFIADNQPENVVDDGDPSAISAQLRNAINVAVLPSFKNRIINGCMRVSQRYADSPTTTQGYTLDRWYANRYGSASGLTIQQVYDAYSSHKMAILLKRTESDTNTQDFYLYQPIEQLNTRDLAGQDIVVSALVGASSALVTMGVTFKFALSWQATTTDQGVGGTWSEIEGDTKTLIDDFVKYSQVFTVPATATQLMLSLSFTGFTGTAGASEDIYVTEVQLEKGTVATEFEYRPYGLEFAMCQRYFQHVGAGWCGQEETENTFPVVFPLRTLMRTTPTLSLISTSISTRITSADRMITDCSINVYSASASGMWVLLTCSGGNVTGRYIFDRSGANIFYADAEL